VFLRVGSWVKLEIRHENSFDTYSIYTKYIQYVPLNMKFISVFCIHCIFPGSCIAWIKAKIFLCRTVEAFLYLLLSFVWLFRPLFFYIFSLYYFENLTFWRHGLHLFWMTIVWYISLFWLYPLSFLVLEMVRDQLSSTTYKNFIYDFYLIESFYYEVTRTFCFLFFVLYMLLRKAITVEICNIFLLFYAVYCLLKRE